MTRIKIEKPSVFVKYNGELEINNVIHYFFVMENYEGSEVYWLGLAPQNRRKNEEKILEQLDKLRKTN